MLYNNICMSQAWSEPTKASQSSATPMIAAVPDLAPEADADGSVTAQSELIHPREATRRTSESRGWLRSPTGKAAIGVLAVGLTVGGFAIAKGSANSNTPPRPRVSATGAGSQPKTGPTTINGITVPDSHYTISPDGYTMDYPRDLGLANVYIAIEKDISPPVRQTEARKAQILLNQSEANAENAFNADSPEEARQYISYLVWSPDGQQPSEEVSRYIDNLLSGNQEAGRIFHIDFEGTVITEGTDMSGDDRKIITYDEKIYQNGDLRFEDIKEAVFLPYQASDGQIEWRVSSDRILQKIIEPSPST